MLGILFLLAMPALILYAIIRAATRPSRKAMNAQSAPAPPEQPTPKVQCPKCDEEIKHGAKFCGRRGDELLWFPQAKK